MVSRANYHAWPPYPNECLGLWGWETCSWMAGDGRHAEFFAFWQTSESKNREIHISSPPQALILIQSLAHYWACDQHPIHIRSVQMFPNCKMYHLVSTASWVCLLLGARWVCVLVTKPLHSVLPGTGCNLQIWERGSKKDEINEGFGSISQFLTLYLTFPSDITFSSSSSHSCKVVIIEQLGGVLTRIKWDN